MSSITNNISALTNSGQAPELPKNRVVLSTFSIGLQSRASNTTNYISKTVLNSFSAQISSLHSKPNVIMPTVVLKSLSAQYYGWKYLNETIQVQPERAEIVKFNFHK